MVLTLLSPLVPTKLLGIKAAEVYLSLPVKYSTYQFIGRRMAEGGNVDILFVGGSNTHTSFDVRYLEKHLEKRLQRDVVLYNFGASWYGAEVDLARLSDAIETLRPKVILLPDADVGYYYPHELARFIWRFPMRHQPAELAHREWRSHKA